MTKNTVVQLNVDCRMCDLCDILDPPLIVGQIHIDLLFSKWWVIYTNNILIVHNFDLARGEFLFFTGGR